MRRIFMGITGRLQQTGSAFLTLLYPPNCAVCGTELERGQHLCAVCNATARRIKPPYCETCSQPFDGAIEQKFTCSNCSQRHFYFDCAVACYQSRGIVRELMIRFKYQRKFYLRHPLAAWMADGLADSRIASEKFDCLVPVPLHPAKERERHFNQAAALAKILGKQTGAPVLNCLKRVRKTVTQTRFDRAERMENLL